MHEETSLTTCERCNRGFDLSNPEVKLDDPIAFRPHCGKRTAVDAEAIESAKGFRGEK
jgi:hypothetical protein